MDGLDEEIMRELLCDSKIKLKTLAKKMSVPLSTIHSRIKRMEKEKLIRKHTIDVDWRKLGYKVKAYVLVFFDTTKMVELDKPQKDVVKQISNLDFVYEIDMVTGEADLLLKVRAKDTDHLGRLLTERVHTIAGISNTRTLVTIGSDS